MLTKLYVRAQNMMVRDDEGATATEYGILVAFIAFGIILLVTAFGDALGAFFQRLALEIGRWRPV